MSDFIDMLDEADWLNENIASRIVSGRLWMGDFDPNPQFLLPLALQGTLALRLNGHALHLPEADTATCDFYDIDTVLPDLYAGVRYETGSLDPVSSTLYSVTLGESKIRWNINEILERLTGNTSRQCPDYK